MHAQHAVGFSVCQHLDEARRLDHRHGTAVGGEREAACLVGDALGLELGFGLAHPCQFRLGVDDPRNGVEVDVARQAGDQLGNRDAFLETLVRQHRAAHAVTHRPDAIDPGVAVVIDHDLAALVDLHASTVGQQALGGGAAANGHQQLVHGQGLVAFAVGVADDDFVTLDLGLGDLGAQTDVQALLLEFLGGDLGHFGIGGSQEVRQGFQDGHFRTQTLPHAAQFQTDHAGTDDGQTLGHFGEVQRADVVHDVLAVELGERQLDRIRTGGDDDVGALELHFAAVMLLDLDHVARQQLAEAVVGGDLVGLEQLRDAAGELLHDGVLAADHLAHVHLGVVEADAVLVEDVAHVPVLARGIQQRLGRNAAHAQAGAAQGRLAVLAQRCVDAGGLQAQLGRADGGVVAGRAGTDDDDVELFSHLSFLVAFPFSWPEKVAPSAG